MSKTILVVDDSSTVRQQVCLALSQAGFSIVEAADGREAIAAIESNRNSRWSSAT
jgi:two-component system chemotaxis response regulator CheY